MTKTTGTSGNPQAETPCLRCGVCCEDIFIPLSTAEAQRIADRLGVNWESFLEKYIDGGLADEDTLFLGKLDGACVFLERETESRAASCSIHGCKPSACRDWAPDPNGKHCRAGLLRKLNRASDKGRIGK